MVGRLQCADGLVCFRPFRDRMPLQEGIRFVPGELRGDGPWKAGDAVITVLGCHGTHPWQIYREQLADYPGHAALVQFAHDAGY